MGSGDRILQDADSNSAYRRLRPKLMWVVSKLVESSIPISPEEALDLFHEFFDREWSNLQRTYDPQKGKFDTYFVRAFARFARKQVACDARRRAQLADFAARSRTPSVWPDADREAAIQAMESLDEEPRQLLEAYFVDGQTERWLARDLGVSRYRVRQLLLDALAQVMTKLERPSGLNVIEWRVACGLWRDSSTPADLAKRLGLPRSQIISARNQVLDYLAKGLGRSSDNTGSDSESTEGDAHDA